MQKKFNKKYWILLPPFFVAGILLVIYLPQKFKPLALVVSLLFWATYYTWTYMAKNNEVQKSK
ncbi:hypothetical protein EHV15_26995 [Paenibacillus oralis]|uniref:Uncharacterized protein n=1 Tax=Paenibacillus oralis TaxID=2490856 RepID=A0A3P3U773_9BACL|nr:hypothetical protein EHV15_26995 [Paenibacillus oralis]